MFVNFRVLIWYWKCRSFCGISGLLEWNWIGRVVCLNEISVFAEHGDTWNQAGEWKLFDSNLLYTITNYVYSIFYQSEINRDKAYILSIWKLFVSHKTKKLLWFFLWNVRKPNSRAKITIVENTKIEDLTICLHFICKNFRSNDDSPSFLKTFWHKVTGLNLFVHLNTTLFSHIVKVHGKPRVA